MKLEHLSHHHPLKIHDDDDGVEISCFGCQQPISGLSDYYGCSQCMFFLHKSCAELPLQMTHHSHPDHLLTLLPNPPALGLICDVCSEKCYRFIYRCSLCDFDFCIKCALVVHNIQQRIEHKSHTHQLISLQKPAMFLCNVCDTKHEGTSYLCTTCGFWVNQKCADSLPTTIKLTNHHHPLSLMYSVPCEYYQYSETTCKICNEGVYRRNWVYYCSDSECRYYVHVNCATSETTEPSTYSKTDTELQDLDLNLTEQPNSVVSEMTTTSNTKLFKDCKSDIKAEVLDPNLIILPVPNKSVDPLTELMKHISLKYKYKQAIEIQHVSHDHPLIFSNEQIDHELCSWSNLPQSGEVKDDERCNGCARSISRPFYHCAQGNFFLHEWCAELPNELRHPYHQEHPLFLITNFHPYECQCCGLHCNTFSYGCSSCKFFLDIKCAVVPQIIRHEAHKHILTLRQASSDRCNTCDCLLSAFIWHPLKVVCPLTFVCDPCNINICRRCVFLPGTVRHINDKHPFTLTYSPPLKDQVVDDNYESYLRGRNRPETLVLSLRQLRPISAHKMHLSC